MQILENQCVPPFLPIAEDSKISAGLKLSLLTVSGLARGYPEVIDLFLPFLTELIWLVRWELSSLIVDFSSNFFFV